MRKDLYDRCISLQISWIGGRESLAHLYIKAKAPFASGTMLLTCYGVVREQKTNTLQVFYLVVC